MNKVPGDWRMRAAARLEFMAEQGLNVEMKQAQEQEAVSLLASLMENRSLGTRVTVDER